MTGTRDGGERGKQPSSVPLNKDQHDGATPGSLEFDNGARIVFEGDGEDPEKYVSANDELDRAGEGAPALDEDALTDFEEGLSS